MINALPAPSGPFSPAERQRILTGFGALLNLQMDFVPAKKDILGRKCVPRLAALAASPMLYRLGGWVHGPGTDHHGEWSETQCKGAAAAEWGLSLVQSVLEAEEDQHPWSHEEIQPLVSQGEALRAASNQDVAAEAEPVAAQLVQHEIAILDSIGFVLEHASEFIASALVYPDDAPLRALVKLFTAPLPMPVYWADAMKDEENAEYAGTAYAQLQSGALHAIVAAAAEDTNLEQLFPVQGTAQQHHWFVEALVHALRDTDTPTSTWALLALGNLVRDNARSEAIGQTPGLLGNVVLYLKSNDVKQAHAALGLLKNLAIPSANKAPIAESGVVPLLMPFLKHERDMIQPLQYAVVGLLKQLANATDQPLVVLSALGALSPPTESTLDVLVALRSRSDHLSMRLEISRVYMAFIRTVYSAQTNHALISEKIQKSEYSESEVEEAISGARMKLQERPVLEALVDLVRYGRKYAVLMSEGLLGLALVSGSSTAIGALFPANTSFLDP